MSEMEYKPLDYFPYLERTKFFCQSGALVYLANLLWNSWETSFISVISSTTDPKLKVTATCVLLDKSPWFECEID